ncbi:MAG TPA: STAS domain-containing protein, partial [Acidimicrobiia bacterium]
FGTETFHYIPVTVLAAIVIAAMLPLVKIGEFARLWRVHRGDFGVMLLAFVGTMVLGLEPGILVAIAASVALIVYRVSRPRIPELGRDPATGSFLEVDRHSDVVTYPGTAILRMEASLYFTNADSLAARLQALEEDRPDLHTVVLDAGGIDRLDSTGDHMLRRLALRYREEGRRLLLANVDEDVRDVLDAAGFTDLVGREAILATDEDAIAALEGRVR